MGNIRSALIAATCILIPLVSGTIVGFVTMPGVLDWYTTLNKPWFTPPGYIFGPVWTILYVLMGISLYLVVSQDWKKQPVKTGLLLFAFQLAINLLWPVLFFAMHSPLAGFADILLLLALIFATIVVFNRVSKPAAILLIPYLAWVCIATALNAGIVLLN